MFFLRSEPKNWREKKLPLIVLETTIASKGTCISDLRAVIQLTLGVWDSTIQPGEVFMFNFFFFSFPYLFIHLASLQTAAAVQ